MGPLRRHPGGAGGGSRPPGPPRGDWAARCRRGAATTAPLVAPRYRVTTRSSTGCSATLRPTCSPPWSPARAPRRAGTRAWRAPAPCWTTSGSNPTALDPSRVSSLAGFPVRLVNLTGSQLAVTYGELNTMADFLTSPEEIDTLPQSILLPILQMVRHQGWEKLNALRTNPASAARLHLVADVVLPGIGRRRSSRPRSWTPSPAVSARGGRDHYKGSLARNACHFAPYTWARWRASYAVAAATAQEAYRTNDPELTRKAWVAHGYADHFLQDSFAAGHLVNKTLVMQWFIDWVTSTWMPVYNWDTFKTLTSANQPGLTSWNLYNPRYTGIGTDPQTTEELPTVDQRRANSGAVAAAGLSRRPGLPGISGHAGQPAGPDRHQPAARRPQRAVRHRRLGPGPGLRRVG